MNNSEFLIPKLILSVRHRNEKQYTNIASSIISTSFKTSLAGISNSSIKFGGRSAIVNLTFPIHQNVINSMLEENTNNELSDLFNFTNYWKIQYGWGGGNLFCIAGMKILDLSLNYDQDTRSYNVTVSLAPAYDYALKDIKMSMLKKTVHEIKMLLDGNIDNISNLNSWGDPLSIGSIITRLLTASAELLDDENMLKHIQDGHVEIQNYVTTSKIANTASHLENPEEYATSFFGKIKKLFSGEPEKIENAVYADGETKTYTSERLLTMTSKDIPNPELIKLILFDTNKIGKINPDDARKSFNEDPMIKREGLQKLTNNTTYYNMNVLQYITEILNDNGFTIFTSQNVLNSDGKVQWIIIQTDFTNLGKDVEEFEYIGISRKNGSDIKLANVENKFVSTIGEKTDKKTSQYFDLHSNRSVVISVNASTEQGRTTYATSTAAEQFASSENGDTRHIKNKPNSDSPKSTSIDNYRKSMLHVSALQSHELTLDCIGLPFIKIGDNIHVKLGGKLFSGKYKIIELEHTFDSGSPFKTSIRANRLSDPKKNNSSNDKQIDETDLAGSLEKTAMDLTTNENSSNTEKLIGRIYTNRNIGPK